MIRHSAYLQMSLFEVASVSASIAVVSLEQVQTDKTIKTLELTIMNLAKPVCALQLPFASLTITLLNHRELRDKFIFEIVGLLVWFGA